MLANFQFVGLLIISNIFMTMTWYGHLKHNDWPLLGASLVSWLIALAGYMFRVPANRIGATRLNLTQLKITQECVTLTVFVIYALIVFREPIRWNTVVSMVYVVGAIFLLL